MATWSDIPADPRAPEEAIDWLLSRIAMTPEAFAALSARAKVKAFALAGVAHLDMVQSVQAAIAVAIAKGTTFEDFQQTLPAKVTSAWGGVKPHRLRLVFQMAVLKAYGAGRERQMREPAVARIRPYHMLDAILDGGTTDLCRGLNGLVMLADDPEWKNLTPPLHFGCRTAKRALTAAQAAARGISEGPPPGHEPAKGFGAPPDLEEPWVPDRSKYDPALWAAYEGFNT